MNKNLGKTVKVKHTIYKMKAVFKQKTLFINLMFKF